MALPKCECGKPITLCERLNCSQSTFIHNSLMTPDKLPEETQERIKADAKAAFPFGGLIRTTSSRVGYIAGATAENERAQVLIDVLEWIKTYGPNLSIKFIDKALQQFKDGKGKEVGNKKPHSGNKHKWQDDWDMDEQGELNEETK